MMEKPRFYNKHTVYVKTGAADAEQLHKAVQHGLKMVESSLGRKIITKYYVNIVETINGIKFGYGYVWFTNPEAYYVFIGKNPDGSERETYHDDPTWVCPKRTENYPKTWEEMQEEYQRNIGRSWIDMCIEEEEKERQYICPKIRTILPPLVNLPEFEYTMSQKEQLVKNPKLLGDDSMTHCKFEFSPAYADEVDKGKLRNVLFACNVPDWVTEEQLKNTMLTYVSDPTKTHRRKVNGKTVEESYPWVTKTPTGLVFVTFDPSTNDAQFARMMVRKLEVRNINNANEKSIIIFDHSRNNDNTRYANDNNRHNGKKSTY
jgi:hypothetical protein